MTASPDLVTAAFVEAIYGADLDEARCNILITVASDTVREYCGTTWDSVSVPAQIKLVVAQMVGDAFANTPGDSAQVKAEQIGDYRVEYQRVSPLVMSIDKYRDVLNMYRRGSFSISTPISDDGVVEP